MCQEPTELPWIGCLTGLVWIPKLKIGFIDTKHQLADFLTKSNFTRDEWNNLLQLCNISHFSSICCAQNFQLEQLLQNDGEEDSRIKEEDRSVAKSSPMAMNLASTVSTNSSSVKHPIASKSPGVLKEHVQRNLARGQEEIQNPTQRRVLKGG